MSVVKLEKNKDIQKNQVYLQETQFINHLDIHGVMMHG